MWFADLRPALYETCCENFPSIAKLYKLCKLFKVQWILNKSKMSRTKGGVSETINYFPLSTQQSSIHLLPKVLSSSSVEHNICICLHYILLNVIIASLFTLQRVL